MIINNLTKKKKISSKKNNIKCLSKMLEFEKS